MEELEKEFEKQIGIGKAKVGLIVCAVLVVILAFSSLWLYTRIDGLETDKNNLQSQIDGLHTVKDSLQSQLTSLETEINQLQTWLDGNETLLQIAINERNQLQTWLDGNITNYESQLAAKDNQIQNLISEIADLNAQIESLNSQIDSLNAQIISLQSEIESLKAPQLHEVEVYWEDKHPVPGSPRIEMYGVIFNSGSQTAYDIVYTVRIYDADDTLLKTEEIPLGNITGKSYKTFDRDISYSGDADYITTSLSYG